MLPQWKRTLQMRLRLNTLRRGDYPGLSGCIKSNYMVLKNRPLKVTVVSEGDVIMEERSERCCVAHCECGGRP